MAGTKEIRTQFASVKSTQKITSAMEMVAASKMRNAQDRMEVGKPYATRMRAGLPFVFTALRHGTGVAAVIQHLCEIGGIHSPLLADVG